MPIISLRDIHKGNLTLKDADEEQSKLVKMLEGCDKGVKAVEKESFQNNIRLCHSTREKYSNFRSKIFPIKNTTPEQPPEPAPELAQEQGSEPAPVHTLEPAPKPVPTKHKTSKLKLHEKFKDEIISAKKDINDEIFWEYFNHQNSSYLLKDLLQANRAKNE